MLRVKNIKKVKRIKIGLNLYVRWRKLSSKKCCIMSYHHSEKSDLRGCLCQGGVEFEVCLLGVGLHEYVGYCCCSCALWVCFSLFCVRLCAAC